ncbi:MAG: serine/threonine-protein kinase [Gemmatimonadetes bacterium]|nr:serine/threonine-protein kinase [Gemmatimonadota bacterium]
MSPRRDDVEALLDAALDQPPEEREAWLAAKGGDPRVLDDVRALLAQSSHEGILDRPSPGAALARRYGADMGTEADEELAPGSRVGPYRIVREVGRGGMAVVYLAERSDAHYHQRVAVKLIRASPDGRELAQRFLAERQIMAALQHPNIARLIDGGVLPDGRPWLAMEFVQGLPVDVYCDGRRLPVEERLRIFCQIAWSIHHAHRNLVVHRDLKPSNILLTDAGDLRLLDFGIAKILDPDILPLDSVPMTRTGLRVMTPAYASPEQLRGLPVTTATDVYALGVVLYELLTGRRPFLSEGRTLAQLEDAVLHEEPPRPSSVVGRDGGDDPGGPAPEDVALARGTSHRRLRRKLSGDLDRIVLTALRKDPERRYESAQAMAADVQRYLEGRPLATRGDAIPYRVGKFVARNRWWVGTAAAFLLLLSGYAGTITLEQRKVRAALEQARLEAERSEQVTRFLLQLFEGGEVDPGVTLTAGALLGEGADRSERHLTVAGSMADLAELYLADGRPDAAEALFRSALATERALLGPEHPRVARSLLGVSRALGDRGAYDAAEALARESLELRRRLLGDDHPEVAEAV